MNVEEIRREVRHLPRPKQGELIARLLEDFGSSDYDVSDVEVSRRVRETGSGEVADISHEELLSGLHHLRAN